MENIQEVLDLLKIFLEQQVKANCFGIVNNIVHPTKEQNIRIIQMIPSAVSLEQNLRLVSRPRRIPLHKPQALPFSYKQY